MNSSAAVLDCRKVAVKTDVFTRRVDLCINPSHVVDIVQLDQLIRITRHDKYTHVSVEVASLPQSPGGDSRAPWWPSLASRVVTFYLMERRTCGQVATVGKFNSRDAD
jgi:hypothetical protein